MKAEQMVPSLQRVAAKSIEVQTSAAGDENLLAGPAVVEQPLEIISPASILVELVERPEFRRRQFTPQDPLAVLGHVPVEIPSSGPGQARGKSGFAHLSRPGDEHHLLCQVAAHLRHEITLEFGH